MTFWQEDRPYDNRYDMYLHQGERYDSKYDMYLQWNAAPNTLMTHHYAQREAARVRESNGECDVVAEARAKTLSLKSATLPPYLMPSITGCVLTCSVPRPSKLISCRLLPVCACRRVWVVPHARIHAQCMCLGVCVCVYAHVWVRL